MYNVIVVISKRNIPFNQFGSSYCCSKGQLVIPGRPLILNLLRNTVHTNPIGIGHVMHVGLLFAKCPVPGFPVVAHTG